MTVTTMKKDKIIISLLAMTVCAAAIAYSAHSNNVIVFFIVWIMGIAASLIVQYIQECAIPNPIKVIVTGAVSIAVGISAYIIAFV